MTYSSQLLKFRRKLMSVKTYYSLLLVSFLGLTLEALTNHQLFVGTVLWYSHGVFGECLLDYSKEHLARICI